MNQVASNPSAEIMAPPPVVKTWTRTRIAGHIIVGVWFLLFAGLAIYLYNGWRIDLIETYGPRYWSGLLITLKLVAISIVIGALLSLPITAARMSNSRWLRSLAFGYVYFFRGTPLLAQTFLIYYGFGTFRPFLESIGLWVFFRDAWNCAILAFSLNTAAYQAEILRGAIESVAVGQWEGAAALGISKRVTFWKVILPQALIVALRPYGNEIILMIKGSAIVAIITVLDLMGETRRAYSRTFDFQTYLWAAVIYLLMVEILRHIWDALERRLTRHLKR
ncbi:MULTISPECIES: ABC transporter permease [Brucella]|uniref:ABC transporter permease n=1 Tax=Brucella suis bv. 4 TaxID=1567501 RepID=A0A7L9MBW7_BRUSS|nr:MULTISPECIES: ABC transporter permease [Brucella]AIJ99176.1 amino ABC transporter, permease, 3-TM region, His/Glu/Gln/Arg/opine family domain protein [Brucella suis]EEW91096.1 polar amino acid ABC transporter [Brucella suis bv. 4 str. 40]EFH33618.1 polar amino acid transport system permease [Brucella abortus bv. 5 str. B3196]KFJ29246.1 amino ABC transporter, permease, 3-TM region, His/Glu/Gln/Arg/opine family domain protein [Brucella suis]QOK64033.1 ABC transporter permease [Brucella suis b